VFRLLKDEEDIVMEYRFLPRITAVGIGYEELSEELPV